MSATRALQAALALAALLLAGLACCAPADDIPFQIQAVYRANASGYGVRIDTRGVVPAGHDVTQDGAASVQIAPLEDGPGAPVSIEIAPGGSATVRVAGQPDRELDWFRGPQDRLSEILRQAGYASLSADEIDETVRAILGAMAGSKGALMDGQAQWLEVVAVEINY